MASPTPMTPSTLIPVPLTRRAMLQLGGAAVAGTAGGPFVWGRAVAQTAAPTAPAPAPVREITRVAGEVYRFRNNSTTRSSR